MRQALAEFGARLGLGGLTLNDSGVTVLEMKGLGQLFFEENGEELLLYLAAPLRPHDRAPLKKALELAHAGQAPARPFQVAGRDDRLVLLVRLPAPEVDGAALENGVRFLSETMRRTGVYS